MKHFCSQIDWWKVTENKPLKGSWGIIDLCIEVLLFIRSLHALWHQCTPKNLPSGYIIHTRYKRISRRAHVQVRSKKSGTLDVKKRNNMFEGTFSDLFNIFDPPEHLINFVTGCVALNLIEDSLIGVLEKGSHKSFYDPLRRSNARKMSELKKSMKVHCKNISLN